MSPRARQAHTVCLPSLFLATDAAPHSHSQPPYSHSISSLPTCLSLQRKKRRWLALLLNLCFSLGCPPVGREESQQVPQKSHQCQHYWPANPTLKPPSSAFLICEITKCLFHLWHFTLRCLLVAVKNIQIGTFLSFSRAEPSLYKGKLPVN